MKVISGHQPVFFHTGLLAKVFAVGRAGGVFFLHDLDTFEEKGATDVWVPKSRGGDLRQVKLIKPPSVDSLMSAGAVSLNNRKLLLDVLVTLTDGDRQLTRLVRQRMEDFNSAFPETREFASAAELQVELTQFLLSRLGVPHPKMGLLSVWLGDGPWKEKLTAFLVYGQEFVNEYNRVAEKPLKGLPFWAWDRERNCRHPVGSWEEVRDLNQAGLLIPKAQVLVWIIRVGFGYLTIRGLGGREYEESVEDVAKILGFRMAPALTVTSDQGVPSQWGKKFSVDSFRPSGLVLWLMDGQFDPKRMISSPSKLVWLCQRLWWLSQRRGASY